jgi:hypothetical protein
MEYSFTISWQCYGINKLLISHTSSLHALYTMPVELISGALHWPSVTLSTAGSGSLDFLVVGVAL